MQIIISLANNISISYCGQLLLCRMGPYSSLGCSLLFPLWGDRRTVSCCAVKEYRKTGITTRPSGWYQKIVAGRLNSPIEDVQPFFWERSTSMTLIQHEASID